MSHDSKTETNCDVDDHSNRDPISGAPGAHPLGTGVGAALGGAASGAAAGTVVGPLGTVVGAAIGAVVGGLLGKGVAEAFDPTSEAVYWKENFKARPYAADAERFDDYGPAYDYGVVSYGKYPGRNFDDIETELSRDWESVRGKSTLKWDDARLATRDAYERVSAR
jgi:hypothetical protein